MAHVLLQGRIAAEQEAYFRSCGEDDWQVSIWEPSQHAVDEFAGLAATADVIVGGNIPLQQWPQTPQLKLFQIPWTGYNFTTPARMPKGVPVANCFEHETGIAEYVLLAMLEWQIGLRKMDRQFRQSGWDGLYPGGGRFHQEVYGSTLGIVGYGHIGEAVARRAAPFGVRCIGTRRTKMGTPPELDWLGTESELPELLAQSDFVLVACDLNDATANLFNADTLSMMKSNAVLINVSRGGVVEEEALYNALKSNSIGGAIIDVWYNYNQPGEDEVWPCNFPFQELDNIILSGHESGWTEQLLHRRWNVVADNVRRVMRGEPAVNVVFVGEAEAGLS
jgi:phosphoglycerate dehydrogenase-like enzyme